MFINKKSNFFIIFFVKIILSISFLNLDSSLYIGTMHKNFINDSYNNLKEFKSIKIGFVGCGYWATNLIKSLDEEKIRDISVFDQDLKRTRSLKRKFKNIKIFNTLNDLIKSNLNCIFLVTPPSKHFLLAKKIIKNKIDLFVEKPVTLKSKHLEELINLAKKNKVILMSGYIYQYNKYIHYIKSAIKKNKLGKIKYIFFERSNLGPVRNDTSCIWDLASHDISTCISILGDSPKITYVMTYDFLKKKLYDISSVGLNFENIKIEIKSSWINPEKVRKIIVIGEKKMLQFDEMSKKNKIKIYNKYAKYPDINIFKKDFFTPKANIYLGKTFEPKINFISPMKIELLDFFSCIKNRKQPISSSKHALKVIKILEKIEKNI